MSLHTTLPDRPSDCWPEGLADEHIMNRQAARLRDNRRRLGAQHAVTAWLHQPLDDWCTSLTTRHWPASDTIVALAIGAGETLSIRDALIVSLVAAPAAAGQSVLMDIAARPGARRTAQSVSTILSRALEDLTCRAPREQTMHGTAIWEAAIPLLPQAWRLQPLALCAYGLWWAGDERAEQYALQGLHLDPECTLAALVYTAVCRGITPAPHGGGLCRRFGATRGRTGNNRPCAMVNSNG